MTYMDFFLRQYLVLLNHYVPLHCFADHCLYLCPFSFGHVIVIKMQVYI
jgi:hypothetical protein